MFFKSAKGPTEKTKIAKAIRPRTHSQECVSVWPIGWKQKKPKRKGNTQYEKNDRN